MRPLTSINIRQVTNHNIVLGDISIIYLYEKALALTVVSIEVFIEYATADWHGHIDWLGYVRNLIFRFREAV